MIILQIYYTTDPEGISYDNEDEIEIEDNTTIFLYNNPSILDSLIKEKLKEKKVIFLIYIFGKLI